MSRQAQKAIQVFADWHGLGGPARMGTLFAAPTRGREVFSFEYDRAWLESPHAQMIDHDLGFFSGPQYARDDRDNFGVFLDSCPDRWGRTLIRRREEQLARTGERDAPTLHESDYLLGVHDAHRMGGLRFRLSDDGPFLDGRERMAAPPWARLRELEHASRGLESDDAKRQGDYAKWLGMLVAPGGSLGGARPKANVLDDAGHPWIAKFPSGRDGENVGRWEHLVHRLAAMAGVSTVPSETRNLSGGHDTFLTRRFDRTEEGGRLHFASAMTMLGRKDGDGADEGVGYLDMAGFLIRHGASVKQDLEELWRRIVFNICVSNTDDHLRNHGFMLADGGWSLSPAYDMNPMPGTGGLALNISEGENSLDLGLAAGVAGHFRIDGGRAQAIIGEVKSAVGEWRTLAKELAIPARETAKMGEAFRLADEQ